MGLLLHSFMLAVTSLAVSWCFLGSDSSRPPRFPSWAPWERAGQTDVMFVCSPASASLGFGSAWPLPGTIVTSLMSCLESGRAVCNEGRVTEGGWWGRCHRCPLPSWREGCLHGLMEQPGGTWGVCTRTRVHPCVLRPVQRATGSEHPLI